MTLVLPAPAKLNLCLHITGRRADGYHQLQTLFQFLDYGDRLEFTRFPGQAVELTSVWPGLATGNNLIDRAAALLQQIARERGVETCGIRIRLHKQLPIGGGLGGGSSDAATTLLGLNRLWGLGLSLLELAVLGLALGADVPVFVHGNAAWGEGVGEQLTPARPPEDWFLVLKPACSISTGLIFSHQGLTRNTPRIKIAPAFEGDASRYRNDCEGVVRELYPEVARSLEWLEQFGPARLTGTGACIFGRFPTESKALDAWGSRPSGIDGFVAKGVNRSPLHQALTEPE